MPEIPNFDTYLALATGIAKNPDNATSLNQDPRYAYEMTRRVNIIRRPPFNKDRLGYLIDGPEDNPEVDVTQLTWLPVRWDRIQFRQQQVFSHVVDWYKQQIKAGSLLLPATAFENPQKAGHFIVTNGTTRMVALHKLLTNWRSTKLLIADRRNVTLAITYDPIAPKKLYRLNEISIIKK